MTLTRPVNRIEENTKTKRVNLPLRHFKREGLGWRGGGGPGSERHRTDDSYVSLYKLNLWVRVLEMKYEKKKN